MHTHVYNHSSYEKARQPGLNSLQPTSGCGLASTRVQLGFIKSEFSADTRNPSSTRVQTGFKLQCGRAYKDTFTIFMRVQCTCVHVCEAFIVIRMDSLCPQLHTYCIKNYLKPRPFVSLQKIRVCLSLRHESNVENHMYTCTSTCG